MSRDRKSTMGLDLDDLGKEPEEFDCLLQIPADSLTVVTLHDARWAHRGRWHLTGTVVGLPFHIEQLKVSGLVEVIYHDKSSEQVHWVIKDRTYEVQVSEGRFSAYTQTAPRYPRGKSLTRALDIDPLANQDVRALLTAILDEQLPDLDLQRKHWLVSKLVDWRNIEVRNSTNVMARQFADERDQFESQLQEIRQQVGDWLDGGAHDDVFRAIGRVVNVHVS